MTETSPKSVREMLLTGAGLVVAPPGNGRAEEDFLSAIDLEFAQIGYVLSTLLRSRLATYSIAELKTFREWAAKSLVGSVGGGQQHTPLFRKFPHGIPTDTAWLWWDKVLVHYLQGEGQPCIFCGHCGSTHVLNPCSHVVCDRCFDLANYSACPVCEHHVDRTSPFFAPTKARGLAKEQVTFRRLDLCTDQDRAARDLFQSFCARKQALSPDDRAALVTLVNEYGKSVLQWTPPEIPLRENIATIFGELFRADPTSETFETARRYMSTATDLLRFIAVTAGGDGSLQGETQIVTVDPYTAGRQYKAVNQWRKMRIDARYAPRQISIAVLNRRFKVPKFTRSMRRRFLEFLNSIPRDRLIEDMLRHQEYWVWIGEFLHPGEYAQRFPTVAEAFHIVRKQSPDGTMAPRFLSWNGQVEESVQQRDFDRAVGLLQQRPGEFARRLDWTLRSTSADTAAARKVAQAFVELVDAISTPVILTLYTHLQRRDHIAPVRVYWPKGKVACGVCASDERSTIPATVTEGIVRRIETELLSRFAAKERFPLAVIDASLRDVPVPFNERTASPSAVSLPRGAAISAPMKKSVRLFMYWRQPQFGGHTTDLDLSVGLYDADWNHIGVCSYYELTLSSKQDGVIAKSAGDLRDAPYPEGASEFVDLYSEVAASSGARFAVMVVNNYAGMPFSQLDLAFAGYMNRDDVGGKHFDPRTVEMRFNLAGENGVFVPLVIDLVERRLHWLDVQSRGQLAFNNVANSNKAITKICPSYIAYFQSGVRPSMFALGLMQAAARCDQVIIRGESIQSYQRATNETVVEFYRRMLEGQDSSGQSIAIPADLPALALLMRGDVTLAAKSSVYAIFREQLNPTMRASDLVS